VIVDRKNSSLSLRRPCTTTLWLTQKKKLDTLISNRSLSDGGFIPRLLICHTDCQPHHIVRNQQDIPQVTKSGYTLVLRQLLETFRMQV
jgi:hypothetical protein